MIRKRIPFVARWLGIRILVVLLGALVGYIGFVVRRWIDDGELDLRLTD